MRISKGRLEDERERLLSDRDAPLIVISNDDTDDILGMDPETIHARPVKIGGRFRMRNIAINLVVLLIILIISLAVALYLQIADMAAQDNPLVIDKLDVVKLTDTGFVLDSQLLFPNLPSILNNVVSIRDFMGDLYGIYGQISMMSFIMQNLHLTRAQSQIEVGIAGVDLTSLFEVLTNPRAEVSYSANISLAAFRKLNLGLRKFSDSLILPPLDVKFDDFNLRLVPSVKKEEHAVYEFDLPLEFVAVDLNDPLVLEFMLKVGELPANPVRISEFRLNDRLGTFKISANIPEDEDDDFPIIVAKILESLRSVADDDESMTVSFFDFRASSRFGRISWIDAFLDGLSVELELPSKTISLSNKRINCSFKEGSDDIPCHQQSI